MFPKELDPSWCTTGDYPEGEIVFLPEEGDSSDSNPILDEFAPNSYESSSFDYDEDTNLGGCSSPLDFSFYMLSSNPPKDFSKFRIHQIDKELSEAPLHQYIKRKDLKDEK